MRMVRDARRSEAMETKKMKADKPTNIMTQPTPDANTDKHLPLAPRDILASGIKRKLERKKSKSELRSEESFREYQQALREVEEALKKQPAPQRGRSMSMSTQDHKDDTDRANARVGVNFMSYFTGSTPTQTPSK